MFWKSSRALGAALYIAAFPASAQQGAEIDACMAKADGVSSKMLDCGKVEIDKWDSRLNAAYQTLLHRSEGKQRAQLQQEQRAWLKHHLSETHRLAVDPNNGSVAFLESQSFELDDLVERTLALEKRVNEKP
ncbi:lysozyme inhibitor LprI family protein [Bradyrhizobium sp. HKCCYLS1011]|uniref:lysozyme inhibitor LprI family protein n=1 Tax=Bradyrhizobium sp. HKCCYLS1011 TaxID=3420733 RepID=UPI003EBFBD3D